MIPEAKQYTDRGGLSAFGPDVTLCVPGHMADRACRALALFLPQCAVTCGDGAGDILASVDTGLAAGAYTLETGERGVAITCADYEGLRNALAALSQLVELRDGDLYLHHVTVCDGPACAHRGIMLDLARGIRPFDELLDDVILAAKARLNVLHLHLCDAQGVAVRLDSVPEGHIWQGAYTKEQMRQLIALCDALALEIIPEYDLPAHAKGMTREVEAYRCKDEKGNEFTSGWVLCPGSDGIFEWMDTVIGEVCDLCPGRYFHLGGVELYFPENSGLNQLCHWDECVKCRALREREGLADMQDEYYYVLLRLYDMVRARGRTMIFWTDQIDPDRPCPIPAEGMIAHYWRHYDDPGRGPVGGSLQGQLAMGYTAINSYYWDTYADLEQYMTPDSLRNWRWDRRPEVDPALAGQIMGSELCAWEYGNDKRYEHYPRTLPGSIALMADKLWTGAELDYTPDYCKAVTRLILGPGAGELDLAAALGGLIPPRYEPKARPDQGTLSRTELEQVQAALSDESRYMAGDLRRARIFADCVRWVLDPEREG